MNDANLQRPVTAYLSLGSNQGDRLAALRGGRLALEGSGRLRVTASSPLYETEPVGGPEGQGTYYNAVLAVRTTLEPAELLRLCLEIEERFGRVRTLRWGARTLDVDLLTYAGEVRTTPDLTLPHPRMHLRRFVLAPLADIAPELPHPLLGRSVGELLSALPEADGVRRLSESW